MLQKNDISFPFHSSSFFDSVYFHGKANPNDIRKGFLLEPSTIVGPFLLFDPAQKTPKWK